MPPVTGRVAKDQKKGEGMKNILLATDLASETNCAFERAFKLASTMSVKFHILHVCSSDSEPGETKTTIKAKQEMEGRLYQYLASNSLLTELHPTVSVVESREPFMEIIKLADDIDAGLIVMGMHGKSKLRDLFVGTTIEKVIRKSERPVLMVKNKPIGEYENLLVGTDFSANSGQALRVALKLAPNGFLHLVHYYSIPDTAIGDRISQYAGDVIVMTARTEMETFVHRHRQILERFAGQSQGLQYRVAQDDAFAGLTQEAAEVKADLIAIGVHRKASFLSYRLGGTARDILTKPPCDVLVARSY